MTIPDNHQTIMPYLMLKDATQFLAYTQAVFGAELISNRVDTEDQSLIHGEIMIGGCTIMCSEARGEWTVQNSHLFIYVEDADDSFDKAIEAGGTELLGLSDQPYGRTGGVTDPFGNVWWITSL